MLLIALAVVVSGCATSNDPRKGGFFGGLSGINSGAYDERVQQRQEEFIRQQKISSDLKTTSLGLEHEAQARGAELDAERQRLSELDENLVKLKADVEKIKATTAKQKSDYAALKQKINNQIKLVHAQQGAMDELKRVGGSAADPARYRVLKEERDRLAKEYKRLLEYSKVLSDAAK